MVKKILKYGSCRFMLILSAALSLPLDSIDASATENTQSRSKKTSETAKRSAGIQTLYTGPDGSWVHRGNRGIIIHRDSAGTVRAMSPFTTSVHAGKGYAEAISDYARVLQPDGVKVYMLIAPGQGEYYLPEQASTRGAEQRAIETTAGYLDPLVTPIFINDTFLKHRNEDIYNRTDHHWSPLGGYYAAQDLAKAAGVKFLPLDKYETDTIRNYVGTMYSFCGDPAVKNSPEDFVYFIPPVSYKSEFIDYKVSGGSGGQTVGESEKHEAPFFRPFPDGSGAAYCTFMGGDSHTVAVSQTGGTPGRRVLIVKDSFGNAIPSNLFGSFEEVHVTDFRYFPHNLVDYVRDNHITDLVFVNCTSLAFSPKTASRLRKMLGSYTPISSRTND